MARKSTSAVPAAKRTVSRREISKMRKEAFARMLGAPIGSQAKRDAMREYEAALDLSEEEEQIHARESKLPATAKVVKG